jgi:hypothetical protein
VSDWLTAPRELCIDASRALKEGRSPAIEKQRAKRHLMEAKAFGEFVESGSPLSARPADIRIGPAGRRVGDRDVKIRHHTFRQPSPSLAGGRAKEA